VDDHASGLMAMTGRCVSVDVIDASLRLLAVTAGMLGRCGQLTDDDDELCVSVDASVFFLLAGRVRSAELIFDALTVDATDAIFVFRALGTEQAA